MYVCMSTHIPYNISILLSTSSICYPTIPIIIIIIINLTIPQTHPIDPLYIHIHTYIHMSSVTAPRPTHLPTYLPTYRSVLVRYVYVCMCLSPHHHHHCLDSSDPRDLPHH